MNAIGANSLEWKALPSRQVKVLSAELQATNVTFGLCRVPPQMQFSFSFAPPVVVGSYDNPDAR